MSNNEEDSEEIKLFKKLKGLIMYRDKSDTEILEIMKQKASSPENELKIGSLFSNRTEVKQAKRLLAKYLRDYNPTSVSDQNNLRHLIYLETIQVRLQDKMNEMNDKGGVIPLQMIDSVHKNLREINELKSKLGLIGEKREEVKSDAYKALELLKDKFKRWREENQGSRHLICPYCGKMVMLKIRTDAWEAQKSPLFQDRVLANKYLIQLYLEKKITQEDVAKVLEVSNDYVSWLLDRWKSNPDYQRMESQLKNGDSNNLESKQEIKEDLESGQSRAEDYLESGQV